MDQAVEAQQHANAEEVVSVASSSVEPGEMSIISDIWRRVRQYSRRTQEPIVSAHEESDDHQENEESDISKGC